MVQFVRGKNGADVLLIFLHQTDVISTKFLGLQNEVV